MREQSPQPKRSLSGPQISTLIRTFSCFFKPKITCKVLITLMAISFSGLVSTASAANYVGSNQCFSCHADEFNNWQASGHPWKLRRAAKARYAKLPLPPGYAWDEISYVIGGANKKARYIDLNGYIITRAKDGSEAKTQYNLEDGTWSFYFKGKKVPYKCGPCHMTAYSPEGNQDGRPGMVGTWAEDGIGCEECHGPGSDHVQNPKNKMKIDRTAESCGKCHQRNGIDPKPQMSGGFIRHHEQINELLAGSHKDLSCTECHEPHKRAILVKDNCGKCHDDIAKSYADSLHGKSGIKCFECHMGRASKSAVKINKNSGDVRTHIFKINTDADADMSTSETRNGKEYKYAKGFITLKFACLGCHQARDANWASKNAAQIHE